MVGRCLIWIAIAGGVGRPPRRVKSLQMILKHAELALLKRGKRWFTLPKHPGWEPGRVVKLRSSGRDEGFAVTILDIIPTNTGFKVAFTPGDTRPEDLYIAAGWPDYTSDPFRAMRGESQPVPEDHNERKSRTGWLMLALKHDPGRRTSRVRTSNVSQTRPERVTYDAGSPEAVRVVRLFHGG